MASSNNALASFLAMQNAQRQQSLSPAPHQQQQHQLPHQNQQHQQQMLQNLLLQHQRQQQQMLMRHGVSSTSQPPPPPTQGMNGSSPMTATLPSISNLMLTNSSTMPHHPQQQQVHPVSHQLLLDHFTSMARASAGMAQPNSQTPNHLHGINTNTGTTSNNNGAGLNVLGSSAVGVGGIVGNTEGSQKRGRGNSDVHSHGHTILSNLGLSSNFALQQQMFKQQQQQQQQHQQLQNGGLPNAHHLHHHPGNISTGVANGLGLPVGAKIHKVGNLDMYGSPGSAVAAQIAAAVHARSHAVSPVGGSGAASGSSAGGMSEDEESGQVVIGECPPAEMREKGRVYTVRGHLKKWDGRRFARCCGANGCTKLAQGPTNYCKGHGGGTRCKSDGCKKAARGGSDSCAVHGGGKRCKNFGCVKAAVGNDFCRRHGGGRRCMAPECAGTARGSAAMCPLHGGESGSSSSSSLAKSPIIQPRSVTGGDSMSPKDDDSRDRSSSETSFNSASSEGTEDAKSTTSAASKSRRDRAKEEDYSQVGSPNTVAGGAEFEHPDAISSLLSIGRRLMEHHSKPKQGPGVAKADGGVMPAGEASLSPSLGASKVE